MAVNHLVFNLAKCCYIIFSRNLLPMVPTFELYLGDSHFITRSSHDKYLGVTFSSNHSWSLHISNICKKTRKHIVMLYRNFYRFADSQTLLKLYTSLVRLHTEYACAVWDPHLSNYILAVENTQKFALRVCLKEWRASYDSLLSRCGISRLSTRRNFLKLCWLFNIFSGRIVLPCSPLSRRCSLYPYRHPNSIQLTTLHARMNSFKYSLSPSSIVAWNSLDFDTASTNSLISFKHAFRS